jgi:hypothetical protein
VASHRWDVVVQLAAELQDRRERRNGVAGELVPMPSRRDDVRRGETEGENC